MTNSNVYIFLTSAISEWLSLSTSISLDQIFYVDFFKKQNKKKS